MITWMQKHRKYLVITIWISTIAFVGAGFVGWGAYSFNKDATSIAKVGKRSINYKQFNLAYSNAYNYYNQMFGGKFTNEMAGEMKLKEVVVSNLINEALMLNFADELGFFVSDDEIKNVLANDKYFQTNGVFDIKKYRLVLSNMRLKEKDYEQNLRRELLLKKLNSIIISHNTKTSQLLSSTVLMEDRLSIDTIVINPDDVSVSDDELKKYWEGKKTSFLTPKTYEIAEDFISIDTIKSISEKEINELYEEKKYTFTDKDGKIQALKNVKDKVIIEVKFDKTKKEALKRYIKVRDGKEKLHKTLTITHNEGDYPYKKLSSLGENKVLKPFKQKDGYKIIHLIKTNLPKPMSFEVAKPQVLLMYRNEKSNEMLLVKAKEGLKDFVGTDIGFVGIDINKTIGSLGIVDTKKFVNQVFEKNDKKSFIVLGNKAILYKITKQKLINDDKYKTLKKEFENASLNLENQELRTNLLNLLQKRYRVERFYKGD